MSCSHDENLLLDYAMGALDPAERRALQAHLAAGCIDCEGRLAEAREVMNLLALSLPPAAPSAQVRDRLMQSLQTSEPAGSAGHKQHAGAVDKRRWWGGALVGAAIAASVAGVAFFNITISHQKSIDILNARLARQGVEVTELRAALEASRQEEKLISSPSALVVALRGTEVQPRARARLIYDPAAGRLHFVAAELNKLPDGKRYELWLINAAQQKIAAGLLPGDSQGSATLDYTLNAPAGDIIATAVTDEPAGGAPQPTGAIQLLGKFN